MLAPAALLLAASVLGLPGIESGAGYSYRGSMVAVKGEAAESRKAFDLTLLVAASDADKATLFWTLEERGRGGFAWPDRFGRWQLDARGKGGGDFGPALLYDRGDGLSVVALQPLLFAADKPLAPGLTWSEGKLEHAVVGEERAAGRDCWRVEVRNQYGPKRILWVDKERPLVAALTETVFIGQGQQFDLRLDLVDAKPLAPSQFETALTGFEALLNLRERLGRSPRTERGQWNESQLKLLKAELPATAPATADSPLGVVLKAAQSDVSDQKGVSSAVSAMRDKIVGTLAGPLELEDLTGKPLTAAELKGHVTVLHFWEYKDAPLEEPYGQVGFLDFLYRQRKAKGVQVFGVAVDPRFAEPGQKRQAAAGVKRLQAFMNLSYPLLVDAGPALKQLGDPRPAGAKLPVFVVLDPAGKVVLYQVGHFEVKRDRGLEELEAAIDKAGEAAK